MQADDDVEEWVEGGPQFEGRSGLSGSQHHAVRRKLVAAPSDQVEPPPGGSPTHIPVGL